MRTIKEGEIELLIFRLSERESFSKAGIALSIPDIGKGFVENVSKTQLFHPVLPAAEDSGERGWKRREKVNAGRDFAIT